MALFVWTVFFFTLTNAKTLFLHGGGTFLDEHMDKVIELTGGVGISRIGVVSAASESPIENGQLDVETLLSHGVAEAYWIPVHLGNISANSDPAVVANVQRMTGILFRGGDQARIIESFFDSGHVDSPVMAAIREVYNNGAIVGGKSAGAAAIGSAPMIMGGLSYNALVDGAFVWDEEPYSDALIYNLDGGIGLLDGFITDSHYSERGREGRLIRLIADTSGLPNGVERGIGLDEDTALLITNAGTVSAEGEVIGSYGVMILDLTSSTVTDESEWCIDRVHAHYLTHGDRINMNDFTVTPGVWKSNLLGDEYYDYAVQSEDIFGGSGNGDPAEFIKTSRSVFNSRFDSSTSGRTNESNPRFQVHFQQQMISTGFGGYHPDHNDWQITYHNLVLNITDV